MVRINKSIIVGLTAFNHEFLGVSVPGLARIGKNVILIIYNDNPCRALTHRMIRRLGFRGQLHIINTDDNIGAVRARVAILDYIRTNKIAAPWLMFANDDDIVLNVLPPITDDKIFAVMGNSVSIGGRLLDVLRVMANPTDYTIDGVDTILNAPHISMSGTFIRLDMIMEFGAFISDVMPNIMDIISDVPFVVPTDLLMWHMFVEYMRVSHPTMSPIYMSQTNYLMTKLNNSRYPTSAQRDGILSRAVAIVGAALRGSN